MNQSEIYFEAIISFCKKIDHTSITKKLLKEEVSSTSLNEIIPLERILVQDLTESDVFTEVFSSEPSTPEPELQHKEKIVSRKHNWTSEQGLILRNLYKIYKKDWRRIHEKFVEMTGATKLSVSYLKQQFNSSTIHHLKVNTRFSGIEDSKLLEIVNIHGLSWPKLISEFPTRDWESLKNRYYYLMRRNK